MATDDPIQPPQVPPPAAPPTRAGPIPVALPPSKWPTVLGTIAIILAALGLLSLIGPIVARFAPKPPTSQPTPPIMLPATWTAVGMPLHVTLSILLLIGGIGLLTRRRWSARAMRIWGIGDLLLTIVGLVFTLVAIPAYQQQMQQQNPSMSQVPGGAFLGIMLVSMCFGGVISLAAPVFALIWFSRRKIRDEVATWA